jgi:hypothetical protein
MQTRLIWYQYNTTVCLDLICKSTGWHPEPEVVWLDSEGGILTSEPAETHRDADDFYTVTGHVFVYSRDTNRFICRVQQKLIDHTTQYEYSR